MSLSISSCHTSRASGNQKSFSHSWFWPLLPWIGGPFFVITWGTYVETLGSSYLVVCSQYITKIGHWFSGWIGPFFYHFLALDLYPNQTLILPYPIIVSRYVDDILSMYLQSSSYISRYVTAFNFYVCTMHSKLGYLILSVFKSEIHWPTRELFRFLVRKNMMLKIIRNRSRIGH